MTDANSDMKIAGYRQRENDKNQGMKKIKGFGRRFPAFFLCLSACATAVFTGLLYHVSDIANNSAIVAQRAFVNYGGPSTTGVMGADGKVRGFNFIWGVGNSGSTPATNALSQADVAPISKEIQKGFNFDELPQGERHKFIVGPKVFTQTNPLFVSLQDLESVGKGKHVYFWGWITYNDVFPDTPRRLTEFCYELVSVDWQGTDHSSPKTQVNMSYPPCATHNCYDRDCEDYEKRLNN